MKTIADRIEEDVSDAKQALRTLEEFDLKFTETRGNCPVRKLRLDVEGRDMVVRDGVLTISYYTSNNKLVLELKYEIFEDYHKEGAQKYELRAI